MKLDRVSTNQSFLAIDRERGSSPKGKLVGSISNLQKKTVVGASRSGWEALAPGGRLSLRARSD